METYIKSVHEGLVSTFKMTSGDIYIHHEILFPELGPVFPPQVILNIVK